MLTALSPLVGGRGNLLPEGVCLYIQCSHMPKGKVQRSETEGSFYIQHPQHAAWQSTMQAPLTR